MAGSEFGEDSGAKIMAGTWISSLPTDGRRTTPRTRLRGILAYNDRSIFFLVSSTNRSSCTFHDDTYRQHKHKKNHLTMAQLPPTVYPAAFGHNSISKRPIDTIFEERVVHKGCDDLVQYGRHRQSNRYRILPTTLEDCLAVTALK
jgi:hypothetical protein